MERFLVKKSTAEFWGSPGAAKGAVPKSSGAVAGAAGRGSTRRAGRARSTTGRRGRRGARSGRRGGRGRALPGDAAEANAVRNGSRADRGELTSRVRAAVQEHRLRRTAGPKTGSDHGAKRRARNALRADTLRFGVYNCNGLSRERLDWLAGDEEGVQHGLGYDLLGLTECHGGEQGLAVGYGGRRLIVGGPTGDDTAAGTAILLSSRFSRAVLNSGHVGCRFTWVELATDLPCKFYVVIPYVPHFGRKTAPFAADTFKVTDDFMHDRGRGNCVVMMGDFNARLGQRKKGSDDRATGRWTVHKHDNEMGTQLRQIMHEHDLVAASTMFQPRIKRGGAGTWQPWGKGKQGKGIATLDYVLVSRSWVSCCVSTRVRWSVCQQRFQSCAKGEWMDHGLLEMRWRMRCRKALDSVVRGDREYLRLKVGVEEMSAKFDAKLKEHDTTVAMLATPGTPATPDGAKIGATLIRRDWDAQLSVDRSVGPISLEELGYEVYGGRDAGAASSLAETRSDQGSPGGAGHGAGRIARPAAAISSVDSAGTLRGHARSEDAADHRSKTETDGRGEAASGAVDAFQSHRRDAEAALDQKVRRLQAVCSATVSELPRQESRRQARLHQVSAETKEIKARHLGEANSRKREGVKYTRIQKRLDDREFSKSCRSDKRKFVARLAKQAEDADKRGDYAEITRLAGIASKKRGASWVMPENGADNKRYESTEQMLEGCRQYQEQHWARPSGEDDRIRTPLGRDTDKGVHKIDLSDSRLLRSLHRLRKRRAVGHDNTPSEFYLAVEAARGLLFRVVRDIYSLEYAPADFVRTVFLMVWKGPKKGSRDDCSTYRSLGLICHAFKLVSQVQVEETERDTDLFQSADQGGFTAGRGTRTLLLRVRLLLIGFLA